MGTADLLERAHAGGADFLDRRARRLDGLLLAALTFSMFVLAVWMACMLAALTFSMASLAFCSSRALTTAGQSSRAGAESQTSANRPAEAAAREPDAHALVVKKGFPSCTATMRAGRSQSPSHRPAASRGLQPPTGS